MYTQQHSTCVFILNNTSHAQLKPEGTHMFLRIRLYTGGTFQTSVNSGIISYVYVMLTPFKSYTQPAEVWRKLLQRAHTSQWLKNMIYGSL